MVLHHPGIEPRARRYCSHTDVATSDFTTKPMVLWIMLRHMQAHYTDSTSTSTILTPYCTVCFRSTILVLPIALYLRRWWVRSEDRQDEVRAGQRAEKGKEKYLQRSEMLFSLFAV